MNVNADPLVELGSRGHSVRTAQLATRAFEDRLGLDVVVLDATRDADDLVDPTYARGIDSQMDNDVHR